jgi:alpha-galactosidase
MKGLDPTKYYKVTELNAWNGQNSFAGNKNVFSGDYLMKAGVSLNIGNPFESSVFLITEQ